MAYATVDELARALRVTVTPDNTAGLTACLDAAAAEIDHDTDRLDTDPIDPADPIGQPRKYPARGRMGQSQ